MSFEIFFNTYEHGQPCPFPLSEVESAFGNAIVYRELDENGLFWRLDFPVIDPPNCSRTVQIDGRDYPVDIRDGSEVYARLNLDGPVPTTNGFMIKGPATHPDFYAALFKLLKTGHSALFWPGKNALVIGQPASIEHLPEGMIETLGAPFLVTEPGQIVDRIGAS